MSTISFFAKISIAAGAVQPINVEGRNFHVVFAPVDLEIKRAGGEFGIYPQGTGSEDMPNGETFRRLEVKNTSLGDIFVTIYIGGPQYRDSRSAIIEPKTRGVAHATVSLATVTGVTLTGIPSGNQVRRKAVTVTNLDPTLSLQIRDSAAGVLLTVFPETSITLPISEGVQIYNANGAAVALNISEIWWEV